MTPQLKPAPKRAPVVIIPKKPAQPAETVTIPAELLDAYAEARKLHDEFAPLESLFRKLDGQIKTYTDRLPNDSGGCFEGERFALEVSERGNQREVNMKAAQKKLGTSQLLSIATVTQAALNRVLPKPEVEDLLVETQTGSRRFTVISKDVAAAC